MPKQIRVNGFAIYSPVHLSPGLWRHPESRALEFNRLGYWQDVARILERGLFDALFIADSLGVFDIYADSPDAALRSAVQVPKHDPAVLVPALAAVTEHLGFGITSSTSYEHPFTLARRFSTLDHLTQGRIAWNIVTGYAPSSARAMGAGEVKAHDLRYDIADEFLEASYKLWEASWEDGALLADKSGPDFIDPTRVHRIVHHGEHFTVDGIHLVDPSPQRTPFLFQAGTSPRGRAFAARHAEAVFLSDPSKAAVKESVADIRALAQANGRDPQDVKFYALATTIVGRTEAEAQAKREDYRGYIDYRGTLALFSGWTGIDLAKYDLDDPFPTKKNDTSISSAVDSFSRKEKVWTIREVIEHNAIGGWGPVLVGSVEQVADQLQEWMAETDIDGFNLSYAISPGGYADFADLIVPELQRRGVYRTAYAPGSLREKVFARKPTLPQSHPAAAFRPGALAQAAE